MSVSVIELSSHNELPDFPTLKRLYTGDRDEALALYQKRYGCLPDVVWHIGREDYDEWWMPKP